MTLPEVPGVPRAHVERMFGGKSPSDVDVAFPADAMRYYVPFEEIPREYRSMSNVFTMWGATLFFGGEPPKGKVVLRDGFDMEDVKRRVRVCLGTFASKHEHKQAQVGYMLGTAFEFEPVGADARNHS